MKILILLIGLTTALGVAGKKTASDIKEISQRNELRAYEKQRNELRAFENHPNLLPEVVITAPRISPDAELETETDIKPE